MMIEKRHANVALFVPHAGCPHDCVFCNQRAIAGVTRPTAPDDVRAACETALRTLPEHATAQIAFFGGSFTAIDKHEMVALLEAAQPFLRSGRFDGIRVSTRPDAVDDDGIALLKTYGVTAVELGAQSMDDRVLAACGRGHTAEDTRAAAHCIRRHGLSLGLQMMTGLPEDTDEGARRTANELIALCPDTVRIYPTVVLKGTALAHMMKDGRYRPQTLREAVALCAELLAMFEIDRHIPVIRLGLHDGEALRSDVLAGGYHPAFRELCEGQLYGNIALAVLSHMGPFDKETTVTLKVSPKAVSKMIGQKKRNIDLLAQHGFRVRVQGDGDIPLWEVRAVSDTRKEENDDSQSIGNSRL